MVVHQEADWLCAARALQLGEPLCATFIRDILSAVLHLSRGARAWNGVVWVEMEGTLGGWEYVIEVCARSV